IIFTVMVCTGGRCSELMDLEWKDVDLRAKRATLDTKTGVLRHAFLPPAAVAALKSLPHRDGKVFVWKTQAPKHPGGKAPKVFEYKDRDRQEGGQMKTAWKGALRRAGFADRPWPGVHTLRRTWASWHYAINKDLLKLQTDGCWQKIEMVTRYAHVMKSGYEQDILDFWNGKSHVLDTATLQDAADD